MPPRVATALAATLTITLISVPLARAQDTSPGVPGMTNTSNFQTGSEARRAQSCAGDYVCDEDGSWAIGSICPSERMMRSSLEATALAIQNGKVTSAGEPSPTQQAKRD